MPKIQVDPEPKEEEKDEAGTTPTVQETTQDLEYNPALDSGTTVGGF